MYTNVRSGKKKKEMKCSLVGIGEINVKHLVKLEEKASCETAYIMFVK